MEINRLPETYFSKRVDHKLSLELKSIKTKRVFIITGPHISKTDGFITLIQSIEELDITVKIFRYTPADPDFNIVHDVVERSRRFRPDTVIGIGGGSPLDLSKVVALLTDKSYGIEDIDNFPLTREVKLFLIPTSSGTGSEITPISIITDSKKGIKKGIIDRNLIPDKTFLYGQLTMTMPPKTTAYTGVDALCHATEAYLSKKATPFSDIFVEKALKLINNSLLESYRAPDNLEARSDMLLASYYAGIAFSNSSVTAVHAFAYPLGGTYKVPHGLANAIMLEPILRFNRPEIPQRVEFLEKFLDTDSLPDYVKELNRQLDMPTNLEELGIPSSAIEEMAEKVIGIERLLSVNPRTITLDDAKTLYKEVYSA